MCNPWKDKGLKMKDEFGNESPNSKTREQLQDDLKKYGITPRPGFDPSGPNLPEYRNYLDDSKEKAKEEAKAKKAGYPSAEAEEKALRQKAIEDLTNKKGTSLNKEAARGGGGGGIPLDKMDKMKKMNYKAGGKVSSASKRGDGIAQRGKTRGKIV
jgi:hypothetical protein